MAEHSASPVAALGFLLAVWTGAYLLTHRVRSTESLLAVACTFALAGYFLHAVLCLNVPAVGFGFLWRRLLGWAVLPFFGCWLHLSLVLARPRLWPRRPILIGSYAAVFVLTALWLGGRWTFSTNSLDPFELRKAVVLYGAFASVATVGVWLSATNVSFRRVRVPLAVVSLSWGVGAVFLSGQSLETIAEELDISSRQVSSYVDRLAGRLLPVLDRLLRGISV